MRRIMLTLAVLFTMGTAMTTFTSCRDTKSADDVGDAIEDVADDVGDAID